MIHRRQDWPARLDAALMAARGQRFAWGAWDCALFAADLVDAMCASRLAARWRGKYKTARGARGILRRAGGIEAVMARIGRAVPVRLAQRGDVVLLPAAGEGQESAGVMLAVCLGERLVGAGPQGLSSSSPSTTVSAPGTSPWRARREGRASLALPMPALADPVSITIAAVGAYAASVGASVAAGVALGVALTSTTALVAGLIGGVTAAAGQLLAPKPKVPEAAFSQQVASQQSAQPRRVIYGRARVAPDVPFSATTEGDRWLHLVHV